MGMPWCYHGVLGWDLGGCSKCHEKRVAEDDGPDLDGTILSYEDVKRTTNVCVDKGLLSPERRITWDSVELGTREWALAAKLWWKRNRHETDIGGEG